VSTLATLARPRRLSLGRRVALGAEAVATYVRVRALLRRHDVRETVARLRGEARSSGAPGDHAAALRLARAAALVLRPLPGDTRCLTLSLVVCAMLARRGAGATVVIGVRPGSPFGAHAWPELGGRALLPAREGSYERLVDL
jgi:hypothetical protein